MKYSEQLKHPFWQRKRLKIMQRDKWTCVMCKSKENTLNVHHKFYKKNKKVWEYEDGDLVTLCEFCHNKIHYSKDFIFGIYNRDNKDELRIYNDNNRILINFKESNCEFVIYKDQIKEIIFHLKDII